MIEIRNRVVYIVPSTLTRSMIKPKKSLGQNFLHDDNIARNIVQSLALQSGDHLLEIGPGKGALTKFLIRKTPDFLAVELDPRAVALLRETFGDSLELLQTDVLTVSLIDLAEQRRARFKVVGNIPYYITSEILFWLLDQHEAVLEATLMVQLEVAQRFVAKPRTKEYGILSIFSQHYTEPRLLFKVSRNSFYPVPKVDSAVVRLVFKRDLPDCDHLLFRNIVRATFGKRRKTLRNGLKFMGFTDDQLDSIGFDLTRRSEELSPQDYVELSGKLQQYKNHVTLPFS
ncbi:MAG: 16S rRNA (adenine(1518)-N(6)/adenine(1519)-N(6))-dimethyltransferase RsmA [Bacteroidota bacterium]